MYLSKTVYFPDHPLGTHTGLTVPFSSEPELFKAVERLSSYTIRQILGTSKYADLCEAASNASLPTSTFVRTVLRDRVANQPAGGGLQATFKGGKGSPLHEWFPYLEGYSPDFVRSILDEYVPEAEIVLDPFCGSGTTALVAAALGKRAYYCEVNPVCRAIIEAKTLAQSASKNERTAATGALHGLADRLDVELNKSIPDEALDGALADVFGHRPFFPRTNYEDVLRLRTLLDQIHRTMPLVSRLATVAALRSLVPASYLVRRGDLRFRTSKELAGRLPSFRDEVKNSLHLIASDLADIQSHEGSVELLCENARDISEHTFRPQAIITSPPYLNGTNYFRNTKIELWFIRCLRNKRDLRAFRDQAITSGINDVTSKKTGARHALKASPQLEQVLEDLLDDAYDFRIPMMVASYFNEMSTVARRLRSISDNETKIAIDLGDSCYGSVWVPTDRIINDIMRDVGFELTDEVILRERQSRDGRKLRQTLQVFKTKQGRPSNPSAIGRIDGGGWTSFKATLPHQIGEFAKRNWGHPWHSMCSFQGKLKPSIAHHLVRALMPVGEGRLLDPFSGVGTIPLEARLEGHVAYGFDISPAAVAISRAKLSRFSLDEVARELGSLSAWIEDQSAFKVDMTALDGIRFNGPLASYFHPRTLAEIVAARDYFRQHEPTTGSRALVMSALLHILHGNRPYALSRRSHPITPFAPTGDVEYRALIPRLTVKVDRLFEAAPDVTGAGVAYQQDVTAPWPDEVDDLDAIITSPPFFDSTRFYSSNWMRLWFAGWNSEDFKTQPRQFVDERQKLSLEVYDGIFGQCASRLKRDGFLALHLGKSAKCNMAEGLAAIAQRHLTLVDVLDESVAHCESHGIRDKGTVTHHQYLLLRKA